MINPDWEKNQEILEVFERLKRLKEHRLKSSLSGRLFGRSNAIKPDELERVFRKRGIKAYIFDEFCLEDPKNYERGQWEDTGQREGYDREIIVFKRPKAESFSFIQSSRYFTPVYFLIKDLIGRHEWKSERPSNQKIVETIDSKEAEELIKKGYSLVNQGNVDVQQCHHPNDVSPVDWPEPKTLNVKLFTLAHPDTSKQEIDIHMVKAKKRHYSYSV